MRLFAGIALDAPTRAACANAQTALQRAGFAARFENPQKLHVTLAFLGNVDEARYGDIAGLLKRVAAETHALSLVLDKVGAFPNERRPRVVYAGARDQGAAFRALATRLRDAYAAMGFTFSDDPVAHVTIARVKDPQRALPLVEMEPHRLPVEALTLFESIFDKENNTSRYVESATYRLLPPSVNAV